MCIIGAIYFTHQWQTGQKCHLTSHIEGTMRNIPPWMALTLEAGASILWKANLQYVFTTSTISSLWTSNPNSLNYCKKKMIYVLSRFSCVQLSATQWTLAHQTPLSIRFSSQEYWSGLPFSFPGNLPNPGIEPMSLRSSTLAGRFFTISATWEDPFSL